MPTEVSQSNRPAFRTPGLGRGLHDRLAFKDEQYFVCTPFYLLRLATALSDNGTGIAFFRLRLVWVDYPSPLRSRSTCFHSRCVTLTRCAAGLQGEAHHLRRVIRQCIQEVLRLLARNPRDAQVWLPEQPDLGGRSIPVHPLGWSGNAHGRPAFRKCLINR